MLRAIHAREGKWGDLDAEAEIIRIGQDLELSEDQTLEMFKRLVDDYYVDPVRILQAPPARSEYGGQVVGFGSINVSVSTDMGLTDMGLAAIG